MLKVLIKKSYVFTQKLSTPLSLIKGALGEERRVEGCLSK